MNNLKKSIMSVAMAAITAAPPILSSYAAYASDITVNDDGTVTQISTSTEGSTGKTDETKFFCLEQCDETIYKYDSINCPSSKNVLGGEKCGDKYSKCTCTSNAVEVLPGDYTLCAEYDSCTSKCIKLGDCRTLGSQWKSYKYFSGTTGTSRLKSECHTVVK